MMVKLDEICKLNMGQSPDSSTYNEEQNGLPFFQGNADFGEIYPKVRLWCSEPTKIANTGDILISVRAPIGALNFAGCKCCIGRGLAAIQADNDKCLQKYLWYCLASKVKELNSKGTGSTFKAISKSILCETQIPLPPLEEQRKIAETLDKVSDLIAKRKQQLEKLDLLVKSKFVEMFGDSKINSKKWLIKQLQDISSVGSSKRVFVDELQNSGIPFYRGTEIGALAENEKIKPELFITQEHYNALCEMSGFPQKGDLLMPSICPDGRIWLVNTDEPFYFKDGRVLWVHSTNKEINAYYLKYILKEKFMMDYNNIASGTTFAELKIFALKNLEIMLPPIELQNQFADFVQHTEKTKTIINQSLEKLETLKKALMQEYFR